MEDDVEVTPSWRSMSLDLVDVDMLELEMDLLLPILAALLSLAAS